MRETYEPVLERLYVLHRHGRVHIRRARGGIQAEIEGLPEIEIVSPDEISCENALEAFSQEEILMFTAMRIVYNPKFKNRLDKMYRLLWEETHLTSDNLPTVPQILEDEWTEDRQAKVQKKIERELYIKAQLEYLDKVHPLEIVDDKDRLTLMLDETFQVPIAKDANVFPILRKKQNRKGYFEPKDREKLLELAAANIEKDSVLNIEFVSICAHADVPTKSALIKKRQLEKLIKEKTTQSVIDFIHDFLISPNDPYPDDMWLPTNTEIKQIQSHIAKINDRKENLMS